VPILVALVAGDVVSGEASMGTLRLLAAKPVSRAQIILAKYFCYGGVCFCYAVVDCSYLFGS